MKKLVLIILLFLSYSSFSQYDQQKDTIIEKEFKRPRFFLKTELLKTLYLPTMNKGKALYFDAQFTVRIVKGLHLVNTIYWQRLYIYDFAESGIKQGYYLESERKGKINAGIRSAIRLFPFYEEGTALSHSFIEFGYDYHNYSGTTDAVTYYSSANSFDTKYHQDIRLKRNGFYVNIGISNRFDEYLTDKNAFLFSPEFSIGVYKSDSEVVKNEFNILIGNPEIDKSYPKTKWGILIRLKVGIGY